jgi:hypothetical protein
VTVRHARVERYGALELRCGRIRVIVEQRDTA